ncbi:unnamed protein product [Medioppia subpectinata]|uniref:Uncharacterized protein n=1 Tax=Medioppia subpectinata TaxID=1979941 RepID=A0A7R9KJN5_9ACAR|nr:unnamed protein product [Medioppia subpectinata]CAG2104923.1 unnamed protein product [Medioppia subpectinata]
MFKLVLLITMTTITQQMVHPYNQAISKTLHQFDLNELTGRWYSVYNSGQRPGNSLCPVLDVRVDNGNVTVTERLGIDVITNEILISNQNLKGKLEKVINMGTFTIGLPWYILQVHPVLVVYKQISFNKHEDQWSVYSRAPAASVGDVDRGLELLAQVKPVGTDTNVPAQVLVIQSDK